MVRRSLFPGICLLLITTPFSFAHFEILISDVPWVERGGTAIFLYYEGHPFEMELVAREAPEAVNIIDANGNRVDATASLVVKEININGSTIPKYQFEFSPKRSGDYIASVKGKPETTDKDLWETFSKLVLHCNKSDGWDQVVGDPIEIVPLTRPYGIRAGSVFTGKVLMNGQPAAGIEIEFEEMNDTPPAELPAEPLITGVVKTDTNGQFAVTLDREGWWGLAASAEAGTVEREGKQLTRHITSYFWIYIHPGR